MHAWSWPLTSSRDKKTKTLNHSGENEVALLFQSVAKKGRAHHQLLGAAHYLCVEFPRNLCSLTLNNLFDATLAGKLLIVLSVPKKLDQLLAGNKVIEDHYFPAVAFDEVVLMLAETQQSEKVLDKPHCRVACKSLGQAAYLPELLELMTVAFPVFLGDLHEFGVVTALSIFIVASGLDEVVRGEVGEIVDFVPDDARVVLHDGLNLASAVLQQSLLLGFPNLPQEFEQKPAEVNFRH